MITFFRRFLASPWVLGLFALVLVAFLVTGVNTRLSGLGGTATRPTGDTVATIGSETISSNDVISQAQQTVAQAKQQNPNVTMAVFVSQGEIEKTVGQLIDATAIALFGRKNGFAASKRLVDGQIAAIPRFQNAAGAVDMDRYRQALASLGLTDAQLRNEIAGDLLRQQVLSPVSGAAREATGLALPYAALLMERRAGSWGLVPASAMPPAPPPTDAALPAFYRVNIARYTLPERRSIRYALFSRDTVAAAAKPSDADLKTAYEKVAAKQFAAKAERTLTQIVFAGPDGQARANALVAQVKGGTPFTAAAGANAIKVGEKTQAEFADFASPAVAAAAFTAPVGGVSAPAQSPFGWHVVHVDSARTIPGKSFEQVRPELMAIVTKAKSDAAMSKLGAAIQDELAGNATFDDVVRMNGLTAVTTPPLLPSGRSPVQRGYTAPPEVIALLKPAFQAEQSDPPNIEPVKPNESFALMVVAGVAPAAPQPFAAIHDQVKADMAAVAASSRARAVAAAILAKVNAGMTLQAAFAGAGVKLPPLQTGSGTRAELSQKPDIPAPQRLLATMVPGKAKLLPASGNGGWYVVRLDSVQASDPNSVPGLVDKVRSQFNGMVGNEYAQELANAARALYPPKQNDQAIAAIKTRLAGPGQ